MSNTFTPTAGLPEINASGLCEMARHAAVRAVIEHDINALKEVPGFRDAIIADATRGLFKLAFEPRNENDREDYDNVFQDLQTDEMERSLKALRVLRCVTDELHRLALNAMDEMKDGFKEQWSEIDELAAKFGGETLVEDYPADWPDAAPDAAPEAV